MDLTQMEVLLLYVNKIRVYMKLSEFSTIHTIAAYIGDIIPLIISR
jgi:hypothetical protein